MSLFSASCIVRRDGMKMFLTCWNASSSPAGRTRRWRMTTDWRTRTPGGVGATFSASSLGLPAGEFEADAAAAAFASLAFCAAASSSALRFLTAADFRLCILRQIELPSVGSAREDGNHGRKMRFWCRLPGILAPPSQRERKKVIWRARNRNQLAVDMVLGAGALCQDLFKFLPSVHPSKILPVIAGLGRLGEVAVDEALFHGVAGEAQAWVGMVHPPVQDIGATGDLFVQWIRWASHGDSGGGVAELWPPKLAKLSSKYSRTQCQQPPESGKSGFTGHHWHAVTCQPRASRVVHGPSFIRPQFRTQTPNGSPHGGSAVAAGVAKSDVNMTFNFPGSTSIISLASESDGASRLWERAQSVKEGHIAIGPDDTNSAQSNLLIPTPTLISSDDFIDMTQVTFSQSRRWEKR
ncbi:hypothetical protein KC367_g138 [Hortaea werneckii]|nr:hypothetical protein KC367_g138 [Hortaea werneckii]